MVLGHVIDRSKSNGYKYTYHEQQADPPEVDVVVVVVAGVVVVVVVVVAGVVVVEVVVVSVVVVAGAIERMQEIVEVISMLSTQDMNANDISWELTGCRCFSCRNLRCCH